MEAITQHEDAMSKNEDIIKFRISIGEDELDELMTYDQVMQYINSYENDNGDILWQFQEIIGHEHVRPHDPTYGDAELDDILILAHRVFVLCDRFHDTGSKSFAVFLLVH